MYISFTYIYIYIHIYIYIYDYKVSNSIMSTCFDHKTTFPDTHRNFHPAIEISRKFTIASGLLEPQKSDFENKTCLDTQPMYDTFDFFSFQKTIFGLPT